MLCDDGIFPREKVGYVGGYHINLMHAVAS